MTPFDASEWAIRASLSKRDTPAAVRAALDVYGAEVFGFLCGVLADRDAAANAYADVAQRVATEVEEFRWTCSLRAWIYWIARRELDDRRRRGAAAGPSSTGQLDPTITESHRRAGTFLLRRRLREEEREILILRVDRGLGWSELALTTLGEGASEGAVARETLKLRGTLDRVVREIHEAHGRELQTEGRRRSPELR
jgi:RNA polymerase sigma-70 factor (ECF subfamily)